MKRSSPKDARRVETADDIDELVSDKREGWRASPAKARRRQRRYKKRLTQEVARWADTDFDNGFEE
ncbi:hypothetical protein [Cognatishimia sp. MH4019]|uniref:hypothetical protein n=1 Tax=Cognatishimia sp. MH4019 TaxID=2854030 RepID=UPI001CD5C9C5|nr:hypothetical protein [Cognatishimia sp. MH4019]